MTSDLPLDAVAAVAAELGVDDFEVRSITVIPPVETVVLEGRDPAVPAGRHPGTGFYVDPRPVVVRDLEVPSGGGVGTARAIAKAYGVFASGGSELGLRSETIMNLRGDPRDIAIRAAIPMTARTA